MRLLRSVLALASLAALAIAQCDRTITRKEWKDSSIDKAGYVAAVKAIMARPDSNQFTDPTTMSYHDFVHAHSKNVGWAHNCGQFYPFHRAMLRQWDLALASAGYADGQPFWDWTMDASDITGAAVFDSFLGSSNANAASGDYCIKDGVMKGYVAYNGDGYGANIRNCDSFGNAQNTCPCTSRNTNSRYRLYPPSAIQNALQALSSYDDFRLGSEGQWHGSLHLAVGNQGSSYNPRYQTGYYNGHMSDASYSPNDILFWFHHAQVDRIWWRWQNSCPTKFTTQYQGTHADNDPIRAGQPDQITDQLDAWPFKVSDVMNLANLCTTYASVESDLPLATPDGCPAGPPPPPTSVVPTPAPTPTSTSTTATNGTSTLPPGATPASQAGEVVWMRALLAGLLPSTGAPGGGPPVIFTAPQPTAPPTDMAGAAAKLAQPTGAAAAGPPSRRATIAKFKPQTPCAGGVVIQVGKWGNVTVPEGHRVYYRDGRKVVTVPCNYHHDKSTGVRSHPEVKPTVLRPDYGPLPVHTPLAGQVAPEPGNCQHLQYPTELPADHLERMGMSPYFQRLGLIEAAKAVDACNNKPGGCDDPSIRCA